MTGTVVAGGKIVLLGEYAVVDGGPAWVAAVDRGVACRVTSAPALEIVTPGDDRFVRAALTEVRAPAARYTFADWRPVEATTKVGLGGSAAATVAAVLAGLSARGAAARPAEVHEIAHRVHHGVQGSGSGIDVAASALGGVLRFQPGRDVLPGPPIVPVVVFSGASARTGPRVQQYLAWSPRQAFVADSTALVEAFPDSPIPALREAGRLLRAMAEQAGIAYWTEAIDRIVQLAEAHGGAAKPSGAGGGDVCVALFDDPEAEERFVDDVKSAGFLHIPIALARSAHLTSSP